MTHRVGRITLAAAFIGVGLGILMDNLYQTGLFWFILRLWPGLLILLGLEWLWAAARSHESDERVQTDGGAIFLLIVVAIVASGASAAHNAAGRWFQFTPRVSVNAVAPPRVDINIPAIPAITFGNVPAEFTLEQELNTADLKELVVSSSSAAITVEDGPTARVELRVRAWAGSRQEAEELARSTQLKVEGANGRVTVRGLRSNSSGRYEDEFRI
ncbi:MAG TPA: hypothetical protein VK464_12580, partial [Symbiobacteriaceae bacterium]|nr:hypothetical protein [Symbiobacteriaceae bacterium]